MGFISISWKWVYPISLTTCWWPVDKPYNPPILVNLDRMTRCHNELPNDAWLGHLPKKKGNGVDTKRFNPLQTQGWATSLGPQKCDHLAAPERTMLYNYVNCIELCVVCMPDYMSHCMLISVVVVCLMCALALPVYLITTPFLYSTLSIFSLFLSMSFWPGN